MIRSPKQNILVSFSGGETSAFMINWLLINKSDHNFRYVYANTGEENEETLEFVRDIAKAFNINIEWVEYDLTEEGKAGYKIIDFDSALQNGFVKMVKQLQSIIGNEKPDEDEE